MYVCRHSEGSEAASTFAARLEACPCPGEEYWLARLHLLACELDISSVAQAKAPASQAHVASAETAPHMLGAACVRSSSLIRHELEASLEKAALQHGGDCVALWVAWEAHLRRERLPTGLLVQRALAALEGGLADEFTQRIRQREEPGALQ